MSSRKKKGARQVEQAQPTTSPPPPRSGSRGRWIIILATIFVIGAGVLLIVRPWNRGLSNSSSDANGPIVPAEEKVFPTYSGSASCKECHALEYDRWTGSHHGLAERPLRDDLDKHAFDPPRTFHHGTQDTTARIDDGKYQVVTKGPSGNVEPFNIARVIGHDPLRQFLVNFDRGRVQTLEASYDPNHDNWFDVYGNEDRQPGEWGHWTGRGMTWNGMCAACHNTRLRKNYDEPTDTFHTHMAEMSVGCEACHGPMKEHAQWQQTYKNTGQSEPTHHKFTRDQNTETCATCHSRRGELTGDFVPGQSYYDHYALSIVDDSDLFYPDGQVRDEDYEFTAFLGSKMHAAGVRCFDCHDPHSARTILPGNNLCLRCHLGSFPGAPIIVEATHTFHKPDSPGGQCINCHMPQTTYMQRHGRHDHGFTTPDPLLTKQIGEPNACNRCHTDHDADWALDAVQKWYGPKMDRPSRSRALTIASARRGEAPARLSLQAMLGNPKETFYWKAVATGMLGRWSNESGVATSLGEQLSNPQPLVRAAAVHALGTIADRAPNVASAIAALADDPVRNVRVAVASIQTATADPNSRGQREFLHCLTQQSDQATGQFQLAVYASAHHDVMQAVAHLQKAMEWDPRSPTMRREAAVMYASLGQPEEAARQIEEACRLDPTNAEYPFLLGLAQSELNQSEKAATALEKAVQLDPKRARAWYNLGLVREKLGRLDAAIDALRHGEAADPSDPDMPFWQAKILMQLNRPADARAAAARALQIRPDYAPAMELIRQIK
jgi:tetratricopeptide (TPR) repeat protein